MAGQPALVHVLFSGTVRDKTTAVKNIVDLTDFRLDESLIDELTVDEDKGCSTAIVRCQTVAQAKTLVSCINKSKNVKAFQVSRSAPSSSANAKPERQPTPQHQARSKNNKKEPCGTDASSFTGKTQFVVSVSFSCCLSKEEACKYIQESTGFRLDKDQLELDVVGDSVTGRGVFVTCPKKSLADKLIIECNRSSKTSSIHAAMLDLPLGSLHALTAGALLNELCIKADEKISVHEGKTREVAAKLNELDATVEAVKRGKMWLKLDEYERKEAIIRPLKDKVEELLLQQFEFAGQLDSLKGSLEAENIRRSDLIGFKTKFERELDRFGSALPMYARRSEITRAISENQVCIVLGETGSGKSTQIMQYLYDAGLADLGLIVCTQPRKVAAVSLARRVSDEMRSPVGQLVGYRVGMQAEQDTGITRLLYVTDHVLLNDCLKDPLFKAYSCIVIDEAHERSIYSDLLLGFVKRAVLLRSDLRVVIMSATIDPELFVSYFSDCGVGQGRSSPPVLRISGRAYPVDVVYGGVAVEDYVTEAVEKAASLHRLEPPGDILVFLTSPIETDQACKKMNSLLKNNNDVILLELHGRLQMEDQQKVFEVTPEGKRKIVFATNSAETSITIPGIKYVVDTGKVREVNYDPKRNVSELSVQWVTQSSAEQRKGRAGRTDCGKCVRLYTEEQYKKMRPNSVPEILRVHLGQALLKLMMLGVVDASKFDFVEAPDKDAIIGAEAVLRELEACDDNGITEVGKQLTKLSLEPRLGTVALRGIGEGILFESIVMAAVGTVGGSIFFRAGSDEQKRLADRKKTRFCDDWGDIVTLVNVYKEWVSVPYKDQNRWCKENSINAKSMRMAKNTVDEIRLTFEHELKIEVVQRFSEDANANEKMAKIIFDCYPSNLSRYCGHQQEGYCMASSPYMVLHVHPSSALNYVEDWPKWVVHEKVLTTSRTFMLNATFVKDSWVDETKFTFSTNLLRDAVVGSHPTIYVGRTFVGRLLKDRAQLKKDLESDMRSKGPNAKAVIDVVSTPDCFGGSIKLYSTPSVWQAAAERIKYELSKADGTVWNEVVEEPLLPQSAVRLVVEHGAQVRIILMPYESRQVKISGIRVKDDASAAVMMALSQFGDVESVRMDNRFEDVWGYVIFKQPEHAAAAVASFKNNPMRMFDVELFAKTIKQERFADNSDYTVRVVAQRRPLKGFGYVSFDDYTMASTVASLTQGQFIVIGRKNSDVASIQQDRKRPEQCYMRSVPLWVDSDMIKTSLRAAVGYDITVTNVILPRVPPLSQAENNRLLSSFRTLLSNTLVGSGLMTAEDFVVNLAPVRNEKDFDMRAFLKFSDMNKANQATKVLSKAAFQECPLDATLDLKASLIIPRNVYSFLMPYLEKRIALLHEAVEGLSINIPERPQFRINVSASCLDDLILAKRDLNRIIEGHSVQLSGPQIEFLKCASGRKLVEMFPREMETFVNLDLRVNMALIYGSPDKVAETERRLADELREAAGQLKKNVPLGGASYPKGMIKEVILRYGADLEKMRSSCGAASLDLIIRQHQLHFFGSDEAYAKLMKLLDEIAAGLPGERTRTDEDPRPECPACLTDVEKDSYYVMEYCRHVYCKPCIKGLFDNAIRSNGIPIRCAAGGCDKDVVIQDLKNIRGDSNLQDVYEAALRSFMPQRTEEYKYCVTPNCPMIYRRTPDDQEGHIFNCTVCGKSVCTSCNTAYHDGLTCALYRRQKDGNSDDLMAWLEEDTVKRSKCPKCGVGIEKVDGCNHVTCALCKIHVCWNCKNTFDTSDECYKHLRSVHGGYH